MKRLISSIVKFGLGFILVITFFSCSDDVITEPQKAFDPDNINLLNEEGGKKMENGLARDASGEIYFAFNSNIGPSLWRADFNSSINGIGTQFYQGITFWTLVDVKFGDFVGGNLFPQMFTAYNSSQGAAIYKNDAVQYSYNTIGTKIYQAPSKWSVVSICTGDFNGDGIDELITAYNNVSTGKALGIYKSDGTGLGTNIYSGSTYWSIKSVTSGDFNGDGIDELVMAFNSAGGPAMYASDGNSVGTKFYQGSTYWNIQSLTSGDFDLNGSAELYSALNAGGGPAIYKGTNSIIGSQIFLGSAGQSIQCLEAGKNTSSVFRLVSGFNSSSGSALFIGDGNTLGSQFYQGSPSNNFRIQAVGIRFLRAS